MNPDPDLAGILAARLDAASQTRLGRSLAIFPAFGADCGGCALEFAILNSAAHGLAQHGITLTTHPATADILLIAGPLTNTLLPALHQAYNAMAEPRWVIALGDCATNNGPFTPSPAITPTPTLPIDLIIPGCPPPPTTILSALLTLLAANT